MSRHQRLHKTMNSEQRKRRRLRNRAMRGWRYRRYVQVLQWAQRDGDPLTVWDARQQANATARAWFMHSRKPLFTGKRAG